MKVLLGQIHLPTYRIHYGLTVDYEGGGESKDLIKLLGTYLGSLCTDYTNFLKFFIQGWVDSCTLSDLLRRQVNLALVCFGSSPIDKVAQPAAFSGLSFL